MLSRKLSDGAQRFRQTVQSAEEWIANAELHAQIIPKVKVRYQEIEDKMESLVGNERTKPANSVARAQISVMVNQGDVAAVQRDMQVDEQWDFNIRDSGAGIENEFTKWDGNCGKSSELRRRGAAAQAVDDWESACAQVLAERVRFGQIYKRIMEQRAELKAFQATAQEHRKALVEESNRISDGR